MNLVDRVKNILITPKTEWEVIKNEQSTTADLFTKYVMILALIPVVATFIGQSLIGMSLGPFGSYKIPVTNGLIYAVVYYILSIAGVYLVGFIIDALAPSFGSTKDMEASLKVAVYSYTAAWISWNIWRNPYSGNLRNTWIIFTLSNVLRLRNSKRYSYRINWWVILLL